MVIGWLSDSIAPVGGAEIGGRALLAGKPDWVDEIVYCPTNKRPPEQIDAFIVHNCYRYTARWIEELQRRPVVKFIHDVWHVGSVLLRRWLLDEADLLVFYSPLHVDKFSFSFHAPHCCVPAPIDLKPFVQAARPADEREGNVFVGRLEMGKGIHLAIDWALRNDEPLTLYGNGNVDYYYRSELPPTIHFAGKVAYAQVPAIFGQAQRLVHLPAGLEAYGRTVVEAWAAGCELVTNENIGATWWLANRPEDLGHGSDIFWRKAKEVLWA